MWYIGNSFISALSQPAQKELKIALVNPKLLRPPRTVNNFYTQQKKLGDTYQKAYNHIHIGHGGTELP